MAVTIAVTTWTRKENEYFKNSLPVFSAFLPTRFQEMAAELKKSVVDVKEHYQDLVYDLSQIKSSQVAFPDELIGAIAQFPVERTIWDKEEHEWFLIGVNRFGKDWDKLAELLNSKSPMQVAIYAQHYFKWENTKTRVMKRGRAKELTLSLDADMVDPANRQESLLHLRSQGPIVLDIGLNT